MRDDCRVNQVVVAIVTFRTMEGEQRAFKSFDFSRVTRLLADLFSLCFEVPQRRKKFKGRWLKVTHAVEPDLIIWQNFGVTRLSRCFRLLAFIFYVLFMLCCCFLSIVFLENFLRRSDRMVPDMECEPYVDMSQALADWSNVGNLAATPNGDYHCYCKQVMDSSGISGVKNAVIDAATGVHCKEWWSWFD